MPRNALQCLEVPLGAGSDTIQALAWTPLAGTNHVVCGSWDKQMRCYEVEQDGASGRPVAAHPMVATSLGGPVLDVAWREDGAAAFGGGCDGAVVMWDLKTGTTTQVAAHDAPVKSVEYLLNFGGLVTGGWDAKVRLWDCRQQTPTAEIGVSERVVSMSASQTADYPLLVVATADRLFHCYDVRNTAAPLLPPLKSQLEMQTRVVKVFGDGVGYASGSIGGRCAIRHNVWNGTGETPTSDPSKGDFTFKCHRIKSGADNNIYSVNALAFHPQVANCIVTAGSDGSFHCWDKFLRKKCWKKNWTPSRQHLPIMCCDFNANGDLLALGTGYDWSLGVDRAPTPEGFLLLQHVTPDMVTASSGDGGGGRRGR